MVSNQSHRSKPVLRFLLIILTTTVFAGLLHQVHEDPLMTLSVKPRSVIMTSGWFAPAALISMALAFTIMGLIFLKIQGTLTGSGTRKGAAFGSALGGLYFIGMIEVWVMFPVSLFGEIYTGLVDLCSILLLGLLLGRYMAHDAPSAVLEKGPPLPAVAAIPVIYILARYCAYALLGIESSYIQRPLATFFWTAATGIWAAIMYLLVGERLSTTKPFTGPLVFGALVFGLNWVVYTLFALLFIITPIGDILCRSIVDSLAVVAASYVPALWAHHRKLSQGTAKRAGEGGKRGQVFSFDKNQSER